MNDDARSLYRQYICHDAPLEINIGATLQEQYYEVFKRSDEELVQNHKILHGDTFEKARKEVLNLVKFDVLPRFLKKLIYQNLWERFQQEQNENNIIDQLTADHDDNRQAVASSSAASSMIFDTQN